MYTDSELEDEYDVVEFKVELGVENGELTDSTVESDGEWDKIEDILCGWENVVVQVNELLSFVCCTASFSKF